MSASSAEDNAPVNAPTALLLAPDPTETSNVRFEYIRDLSQEEHDRYEQAYKALFEVLFASTFTYFMGSVKIFHKVWTGANKAMAAGEIRPTTDPDSFVLWATQLRSAALTLCLSLVYHQEQTYREICDKHGNEAIHTEQLRRYLVSCTTIILGTATCTR